MSMRLVSKSSRKFLIKFYMTCLQTKRELENELEEFNKNCIKAEDMLVMTNEEKAEILKSIMKYNFHKMGSVSKDFLKNKE